MKKRIGIFVTAVMILVSAFMLTGCGETEGKKYTQEINDIEFNLHANITTYMMAMKTIEDYNKIFPKTGIALFQPISNIQL